MNAPLNPVGTELPFRLVTTRTCFKREEQLPLLMPSRSFKANHVPLRNHATESTQIITNPGKSPTSRDQSPSAPIIKNTNDLQRLPTISGTHLQPNSSQSHQPPATCPPQTCTHPAASIHSGKQQVVDAVFGSSRCSSQQDSGRELSELS